MLQCLPSFTDLLGTLFPLWQDSLALSTYVRLTFFCLRTESNFTARQDLSPSTATLSVLPLFSYSCRGLWWCWWQGRECLALVGVIRAINPTEKTAQCKSFWVCVCLCVSHMPAACVSAFASLVSGCNCAAPHSLLLCLDLIRVLCDGAAHSSRQGCPRNPIPKFLMAVMSLRCLATGIFFFSFKRAIVSLSDVF